ncbi:uncharacterized protein LOC129967153 isoform X2 [Argiope bruennichi]|uniref:uncharacterized protein LOC129967153 isoform X2 n=1 Tax=Argiope bruennichi TaxID=94029 RepID=UPI0024952B6F|nr:uncharacterized protein LOC129967153 isoform X2 [Argiope bruennichi]
MNMCVRDYVSNLNFRMQSLFSVHIIMSITLFEENQECILPRAILGQAVDPGEGIRVDTGNYGSSSINFGSGGTSSTSFGAGPAVNYGGGSRSTAYRGTTSSRASLVGFGQNEAPQPYNFNYQSADEQGNTRYHRAEADASGTVRGSYGYTDFQGLYRVVDYIADVNGYRASIRSNEPGTDGKESPADVQMIVEQPPFGIQDRYNPFAGAGAGGSGYANAALGTYKSGLKPNVTEESDEYR